jgi:hypothetical protein
MNKVKARESWRDINIERCFNKLNMTELGLVKETDNE